MQNYQLIRQLDAVNDQGKYFVVEFNLGQFQNEKYGQIDLVGRLMCAVPWGLYPKIDLENLDQARKESINFAEKIGLIAQGDKYYDKFPKTDFASIGAFWVPGLKLEKTKLIVYLMMFFFIFDDIVDNVKDFKRSEVPYANLEKITGVFVEILAQGKSDLENSEDHQFPLLKPICSLCKIIYQESIAKGININFFIQAMKKYLQAVCWEHSDSFTSSKLSKDAVVYRRNLTAGVYPTIEAINIVRGIHLSDEFRTHPLYDKYTLLVSSHVCLVNDVFSLKKEIVNEEIDNVVIFKQKKYSLQNAYNKVIIKINDIAQQIRDLDGKLIQLFPAEKNLKQFMESVKYIMDGHILWYEQCKRYGNIEFRRYAIIEFKSALQNTIVTDALSSDEAAKATDRLPKTLRSKL